MNRNKLPNHKIRIFTDGAIRPEQGTSGLAAIVKDPHGRIRYWWSGRAGAMTCNEAEYAAVIFALQQVSALPGSHLNLEIEIFSDSRVVVDQMSGRAAAHAPAMRQAQIRLRELTGGFRKVSFHHISREQNRLADALAFEAVSGELTASPEPVPAAVENQAWEQFINLWRTK